MSAVGMHCKCAVRVFQRSLSLKKNPEYWNCSPKSTGITHLLGSHLGTGMKGQHLARCVARPQVHFPHTLAHQVYFHSVVISCCVNKTVSDQIPKVLGGHMILFGCLCIMILELHLSCMVAISSMLTFLSVCRDHTVHLPVTGYKILVAFKSHGIVSKCLHSVRDRRVRVRNKGNLSFAPVTFKP